MSCKNTDGKRNDYVYDANGNITTSLPKGLDPIVYDPFTQMTKSITVTGTPNKTMSFQYSADNERILKNEKQGATNNNNIYIRGSNEYPIIEKANLNSNLTERFYIYGPTGLIAFKDATATYFVIKDHLGSTRVLFKSTGSYYSTYDYSPFGSLMRATINGDVDYRFTGQEFDSETALYNFRARLYDDELGIFYAVDPAGQNFSPFSYAGNNPVIFVDKDGRWFLIDDLIISAVSFVTGYLSHGLTTGNWGWDALKAGGISAGVGLLSYYTGGAAAGLLFSEGSFGYAMTASLVGGTIGGAGGSIANQLAFNGKVDWNLVGRSTVSGFGGGLIGGAAGYHLTGDPVLTSMIGGAASGGIEGSYEGEFLQGAFMGSWWGGFSGSLTTISYEQYGKYMTNKMLGEGAYGSDYSSVPTDWPAEYRNEYPSDLYDCVAFSSDLYYTYGENGNLLHWDATTINYQGVDYQTQHYGVALGRNQYGQTMVLSKIGTMFPIRVTTDIYLISIFGRYSTMPWQQRFGK